jgi:hypothetical protein
LICGLASGLPPFLGFFFMILMVTSLPARMASCGDDHTLKANTLVWTSRCAPPARNDNSPPEGTLQACQDLSWLVTAKQP